MFGRFLFRKLTENFDYGELFFTFEFQFRFTFFYPQTYSIFLLPILKKLCSAGAENLYRATENKKLKEKINLELSFMNSTLQLLKEQLSELNSAVDVYQHEK